MRKRAVNSSRRRFAGKLLWLPFFIFLYPFAKFLFSLPAEEKRSFVVIDATKDMPADVPVLREQVWVLKEGGSVIAFKNECTHLGCPLTFDRKRQVFVCSCHGSMFDVHGRYLKGPARKDLPLLKVKMDTSGRILIKL